MKPYHRAPHVGVDEIAEALERVLQNSYGWGLATDACRVHVREQLRKVAKLVDDTQVYADRTGHAVPGGDGV